MLPVPDALDAMIPDKFYGLRDDGDHDGQARRISVRRLSTNSRTSHNDGSPLSGVSRATQDRLRSARSGSLVNAGRSLSELRESAGQ